MDGNIGNRSVKNMYREEHLNIKNEECSKLWHRWYGLFLKKHQAHRTQEKNGVDALTNYLR
jgi:hypothetical protein